MLGDVSVMMNMINDNFPAKIQKLASDIADQFNSYDNDRNILSQKDKLLTAICANLMLISSHADEVKEILECVNREALELISDRLFNLYEECSDGLRKIISVIIIADDLMIADDLSE